MSYVFAGGVRIYYEEAGEGQPMVLVHGATQDTLSWHDNIDYFAERGYRVFAIDQPGHGKSGLVHGRPTRTVEEFSEYLWKFIEAKGIKRPLLVGHSMGAGISIETAINHPDDIVGIVAVDGGAHARKPSHNYHGNVLDTVGINPADWMETTFYSVLGRTTPMARQKEMAFDSGRCSPYVQHSDLIAYTSYSFGSSMHKIRCPIHYIMGEDDWSTTPQMAIDTSRLLAAEGVRTEVDVLLGVGHIPHWEQPTVFNALLEKVLGRFAPLLANA
jgi:pimeloyl-ACP methyl ester carboxylesterase